MCNFLLKGLNSKAVICGTKGVVRKLNNAYIDMIIPRSCSLIWCLSLMTG